MSGPHNASSGPPLTAPMPEQHIPTNALQPQTGAIGLQNLPPLPNRSPTPVLQGATGSLPSPPVLTHQASEEGLAYLRTSARRVNALRKTLLELSRNTATAISNRDARDYANSRGSATSLGMTSANIESVNHGQVWRTAAVVVRENLMVIKDRSKQKVNKAKVRPYLAFPSVIRAQCAIVWRDIYDKKSAKTDELSICTRIEAAAAGRTAYNWLNNRHRTIISEHFDEYIKEVVHVIQGGMPSQYKSCAINKLQICFGLPDDRIEPNIEVIKQLTDLTILEHLEARENPARQTRKARALMDHHNQVAMFHIRGQWGGDLIIANKIRRRSEVVNYVAHGSVVFVHDEIRTCPCQAERIIRSMVDTEVEAKDIVTCDDILKEPGLVRYRRGRIILGMYILTLLVSACSVITLSVRATSEGFEKVSGVLSGWSWSLALVSAVHFLIVKNLLPGTTIRHLGQGKRQARDMSDMKLANGVLILLAQDARTNHLLAQGNACAYANRPSGSVQVSEMPSGLRAWDLGLVITDKFAIKVQQNTPLVRKTVENLDGSIHVDWDAPVADGAVGRLLGQEVRVGDARGPRAGEQRRFSGRGAR